MSQEELAGERSLIARAVEHLRAGDPLQVLDAVHESLTTHPDPRIATEAARVRATALWKLGRHDTAVACIERLDDADPRALRASGQFWLAADRPLSALRSYRRLEARWVRAWELKQLARKLYRAGWWKDSRAVAARFLEEEPEDQEIRVLLDDIEATERVLRSYGARSESRQRRFATHGGRVLHVVGKSLPEVTAGYTIRTQQIARAQQEWGLDPTVVSRLGPDGRDACESSELTVDDVSYHKLPPWHQGGLDLRLDRDVELVSDLVEELRPSILHAASDYENALVALEVGQRFRLPVVYEVRGFWEESWVSGQPDGRAGSDYYALRRTREACCMENADAVVTLAETMRATIAARGVSEERIVLVPNAVDPRMFAHQDERAAVRESIGVGDEFVLGYVSGLKRYEGIQYLLEGTAELWSRGHEVRCVVVGDGKERSSLQARAHELGITDRVHFLGAVAHSEVAGLYRSLDIFVVPRTSDRVCQLVMPLKPYEAMAAGVPVAAANTEVLQELLRDAESGVTFEAENPRSLADAVEPFIGDTRLRAKHGESGRSWVLNHRTWKSNGRRYLRLYQSLNAA